MATQTTLSATNHTQITLSDADCIQAAQETVGGPANCTNTDEIVLSNDERQPCEIWTRVMGYHRPVTSFNKGKQSEYAERKCFVEPPLESY